LIFIPKTARVIYLAVFKNFHSAPCATEDLGMSPGTFGVFMAVCSLIGVVVNSLIGKRSAGELDRKWLIILAEISSSLGYTLYLVFHNFISCCLSLLFLMD